MQRKRPSKTTNSTHSVSKDQADDNTRSYDALPGPGSLKWFKSSLESKSQSESAGHRQSRKVPEPAWQYGQTSSESRNVPAHSQNSLRHPSQYSSSMHSHNSSAGPPAHSHARDNTIGPGYQQSRGSSLAPSQSHSESSKHQHALPHSHSRDKPLSGSNEQGRQSVAAHSRASDHYDTKSVHKKRQYTDALLDNKADTVDADSVPKSTSQIMNQVRP